MRYHNLDTKKSRFILVTRNPQGEEIARKIVKLSAREKLRFVASIHGDTSRNLYHYVSGSKIA
jgi:hypothetical protein